MVRPNKNNAAGKSPRKSAPDPRGYSRLVVDGVKQSPSRAMLRAVGFKDEDFLRPQIGIASTRQVVEDGWLPRVLQAMRAYRRAGAPTERNEGMAAKLKAGGGKATIEDLGNDVFIAGTPDDVIAGLQRAQQMTSCDVVLATPSGPDPDEAWKLFTQEVMPVFAGESDADQRGGRTP